MKNKIKVTGFLNNISYFFGTTLYTGLIPGAPGTSSSLITLIPAYFLFKVNQFILIGIILAVFVIGIFIIKNLLKFYSSLDPPELNIDEVCGQLITFVFIPFSWLGLFLGFALFRFFDIIKPPPVRQIDKKIKNAFGVMFDDVVAGILANLTLRLIIFFSIKIGVNIF